MQRVWLHRIFHSACVSGLRNDNYIVEGGEKEGIINNKVCQVLVTTVPGLWAIDEMLLEDTVPTGMGLAGCPTAHLVQVP